MSLSSRARALQRTGLATYQQALYFIRAKGVLSKNLCSERGISLREADMLLWQRHVQELQSKGVTLKRPSKKEGET